MANLGTLRSLTLFGWRLILISAPAGGVIIRIKPLLVRSKP